MGASGDATANDDQALEELVRAQGLAAARTEFRDAVLAEFLDDEVSSRAALGPRTEDDVLDEHARDVLYPDESILAAQVQSTPLAPAARDGFRDELRRRFVAGEDVRAPQPLAPARASSEPVPAGNLRRFVVLALAAAAAVLVTIFIPPDPAWSVSDWKPIETNAGSDGSDATIELAGTRLDAGDFDRIGAALSRGAELVSDTVQLDVELGEWVRLRVQPGTRVRLDALPAMGSGDPMVFTLERGEIFIATLDGYPGNPIFVETEAASVCVTGTVFGVLVDDFGTCVCVARGSKGDVEVEDKVGFTDRTSVEESTSYLVFDGGTMPPQRVAFDVPGDPAHVASLEAFAASR